MCVIRALEQLSDLQELHLPQATWDMGGMKLFVRFFSRHRSLQYMSIPGWNTKRQHVSLTDNCVHIPDSYTTARMWQYVLSGF